MTPHYTHPCIPAHNCSLSVCSSATLTVAEKVVGFAVGTYNIYNPQTPSMKPKL